MTGWPQYRNEPDGQPAQLHTICWDCWYYVDYGSLDPMCNSEGDPRHDDRETCCFHPTHQEREAAKESYRRYNEQREQREEAIRRGEIRPEYVTFSVVK